jgi:hypothetical protein
VADLDFTWANIVVHIHALGIAAIRPIGTAVSEQTDETAVREAVLAPSRT